MSDHLSDVFRTNVERLMDEQGLTYQSLNRRMGGAKGLVRTQILARAGTHSLTLAASNATPSRSGSMRGSCWCRSKQGSGRHER